MRIAPQRTPHAPAHAAQRRRPGLDGRSPAFRAERNSLQSVSLGTAGLGGAWQAASGTLGVPLAVSHALFALSGLVWLVLLAQYIRHGGRRWRTVLDDLHHPGQGFTLAYIPIVGMLAAGHLFPYGPDAARWGYAVFALMAAVIAARLLAHWVTGGLASAPLHPGYLLPVVSAPFISSVTASALHLPQVAAMTFAVGVLYWLAFGTVVLGGLVANGAAMPRPARPTLAVLVIPPAAGGLAWTSAHRGVFDAVGEGFAGLVLFTLLVVVLLLPDLRQQSFHYGYWVFSFPAAVGSNFLLRWLHGTAPTGWRPVSWLLLAVVGSAFLLLYAATLRHARHRRRSGVQPPDVSSSASSVMPAQS
ncbi:SLAC1 family transporter [Streptomyces sp. NPDC004270]